MSSHPGELALASMVRTCMLKPACLCKLGRPDALHDSTQSPLSMQELVRKALSSITLDSSGSEFQNEIVKRAIDLLSFGQPAVLACWSGLGMRGPLHVGKGPGRQLGLCNRHDLSSRAMHRCTLDWNQI